MKLGGGWSVRGESESSVPPRSAQLSAVMPMNVVKSLGNQKLFKKEKVKLG